MMRRSNPWPALVDLFGVLLLMTLGGFLAASASPPEPPKPPKPPTRPTQVVTPEWMLLLEQMQKVQTAMNRAGMIKARAERCGSDTCLQVGIHFQSGKSDIYLDNEVVALRAACHALRDALTEVPVAHDRRLQLLIEGHADPEPPLAWRTMSQKEQFLYNWNLSSERATAVLYEFKRCGLSAPEFNVLAIGRADTDPIPTCTDRSVRCNEENRRTTLRLQGNTRDVQLTGAVDRE